MHGPKVADVATVIDIVHSAVCGYESFNTTNVPVVESDGDGAGFTVERDGIWYDVTVRPAAPCADCGFPESMHNGTSEVFVPVNAPATPTTACDVTDCHGNHGPDYHAPRENPGAEGIGNTWKR